MKVYEVFWILVFLQQYNVKYDLFAAQILKLDKENAIKQMSQNIILAHLDYWYVSSYIFILNPMIN